MWESNCQSLHLCSGLNSVEIDPYAKLTSSTTVCTNLCLFSPNVEKNNILHPIEAFPLNGKLK